MPLILINNCELSGLNDNMNKKHIIGMFAVLVLLLSLSLSGCIQQEIILDGVEIREYQGEKLSSVYDFRENSIKGPQIVDKETYQLQVNGLVENPMNYSYDDLLSTYPHYKKVVTLDCVEGWSVTILWEGIRIADILETVNPNVTATTLIFRAYDGYSTSLPLNFTRDNDILLAYKMNNVTLPAERGFPFQLVAESKWGYKWIKWVTDIEISDFTTYKGFWESRGYSNSANTNESFFGP